jgi:hypothetical protein
LDRVVEIGLSPVSGAVFLCLDEFARKAFEERRTEMHEPLRPHTASICRPFLNPTMSLMPRIASTEYLALSCSVDAGHFRFLELAVFVLPYFCLSWNLFT